MEDVELTLRYKEFASWLAPILNAAADSLDCCG
jgi:hypothetical protein